MMGPVKAALESATRYMAAELRPKGHPIARNLRRGRSDPGRVQASPSSTRSCAKRRRRRRAAVCFSIDDVPAPLSPS